GVELLNRVALRLRLGCQVGEDGRRPVTVPALDHRGQRLADRRELLLRVPNLVRQSTTEEDGVQRGPEPLYLRLRAVSDRDVQSAAKVVERRPEAFEEGVDVRVPDPEQGVLRDVQAGGGLVALAREVIEDRDESLDRHCGA